MPAWTPERPRLRPLRLLVAWLISALALLLAAGVVPGADIRSFAGAVGIAVGLEAYDVAVILTSVTVATLWFLPPLKKLTK